MNVNQNPTRTDTYTNSSWAEMALNGKSISFLSKGRQEKSTSLLNLSVETGELAYHLQQQTASTLKGQARSQLVVNEGAYRTLTSLILAKHELYQLTQKANDLADLFAFSERKKAMSLLSNLTPSPLPESIAKQEKEIVNQVEFYQQQLAIGKVDSTDFYQAELFKANQEMEKFFDQLYQEYPKQANYLFELNYASSQDIQYDLDDQTLFLHYSVNGAKNKLIINVVEKNGHTVYQNEYENLTDDIQKLQKLLQNRLLNQKKNREVFVEVSHRLYQNLIAPFKEKLTGKTTLMIVPEGQLFYLPFEILLSSDEPKSFAELDYFIKDYNINYHYSATAYQQLKAKKTPQNNSLLAFAPVFADGQKITDATRSMAFLTDSLYRSIENDHFVSLPNSQKEVEKIGEILGTDNQQILVNEQATEENLTAALNNKQYQFIHIATHGLVNYQDPKLSALACYDTEGSDNSLFLASEIQQLDLNADLVILSSCESGIGGLSLGNGLIALNRSFVYAGAKNVLFSLWKINDEYSSELMIDFYQNYLNGSNYTEALRLAKLTMLTNPATASPRYWAAFVLMGE